MQTENAPASRSSVDWAVHVEGFGTPAAIALVIHFADGVDHGLRLIELDIFRAIAGEDLFSVRRQTEPSRLGQRGLLLIFEVFRRVRRLSLQVADTVVSGSEHADGPGAE